MVKVKSVLEKSSIENGKCLKNALFEKQKRACSGVMVMSRNLIFFALILFTWTQNIFFYHFAKLVENFVTKNI